ncbi:hypothetical protein [Streptomyces lasiicapitis]|uniref:hypothetical protein n=1 Tax=Streptomyces lasiicapitis TaxID=1923961 RepID=UPI00166F1B3A|nr:hypothetical protein [Streptomyces lasiicapitis]
MIGSRTAVQASPCSTPFPAADARAGAGDACADRGDHLARQPVLAYLAGFAWAFVVFLLCVAEFIALFWLARPDASAERGQAVFCLASLTLGMFWVVLQPLVRLTPAPIVPMGRALRGYRRLARFEREIGQGEPEGER